MAKFAPVKEGGEFEKLQAGTYQAVVSNVYDIGLQKQKNMAGQEEIKHQCVVLFEVNETLKHGQYAGKRFVQSKTYSYTMSQKAGLRKLVEVIIGPLTDKEAGQFDLDTLRGCNVTLTLEQKGEYINIKSIGGLIKGMAPMVPELAVEHVPAWISKKINSQVAPEETPTQADNFLNDTLHANDLLEYEINKLVESGVISEGDKKSTIFKVAGRPCEFKTLTEEQAVKVADTLKKLYEMKTFNR